LPHLRLDPGRSRTAAATDKAQAYYWDTDDTGFGLVVGRTGVRTFIVRAPVRGQKVKITIGKAAPGPWTVQRARTRAKAAELIERTHLILIPKGTRIQFEPPPGVPLDKAMANQFPHALFYAREEDATPEIRALCFAWRVEHGDNT
jgi:hypothetical protein